MTSLNISLPDPLKAYVEECVSCGDFGTPSEIIRNLLRQDKELRLSRLENELMDALQQRTALRNQFRAASRTRRP